MGLEIRIECGETTEARKDGRTERQLSMHQIHNPKPDGTNRRKFLTAAAAITATSTIPKVATAGAVADFVQSSALPPGVQATKVCAATARRLLEISRRNELRQAAQLPPLPIAKELRRMKLQEEFEAFQQFEVAHG
jgi:hypothetical protein